MDGDELYVWMTEVEPGSWSQVGALLPNGQLAHLAHRDRDTAERLRSIAIGHGEAMNQPVEFRRYTVADVMERIP